jgi:hypothetical protein
MPEAAPLERKPLAAPLTWLSLLEPAEEGGDPPGPGNETDVPGSGWPKLETIEYLTKLILLVLLLLGLPWLLGKLVTDPGAVMRPAASRIGTA